MKSGWLDTGLVLFLLVQLWTETGVRSINSKNELIFNINIFNRAKPIPSHLHQTRAKRICSITDLLHGFSGKFFLRGIMGSPKRPKKKLHLTRSASQSQLRIWFVLPAHGTRNIIIMMIVSLSREYNHNLLHCFTGIAPFELLRNN